MRLDAINKEGRGERGEGRGKGIGKGIE